MLPFADKVCGRLLLEGRGIRGILAFAEGSNFPVVGANNKTGESNG
jgi:hypothetical protein